MTMMDGATARTTDWMVAAANGEVFARSWLPDGADEDAAILLFHDSLGSVELWRDFPSRLSTATGRQVIAYDRPGFGRSSVRSGPLAHDFMRDEARGVVPALCAKFGLRRLIPFGHSVGGAMAVATAAARPDLCAAVVTESAQAFVEDRTIAGIKEARAAFTSPDQIARLARYHGDKARWVLHAWLDTWLSPGFAGWTLDDDLQGLRCPVLGIHGERDEYGSAAHPTSISSQAGGGGDMVLLDDCGHVPHREQPDRVLALVAAFLDSVFDRR